jgi:predicted dehydrogenase
MVNDPVRWGIIGCGDVTEVKSGPGLQKAEDSELVAVMRRDAARARDYAQRHGVPRWYEDADALIADDDVDAVYIATPPDSHLEYTRRAAAAGKPVYVEKPMARTGVECEQMVQACTEAGVRLFVAYYRRRLPIHLRVESLLEDGAIGEPRFVSIRHVGIFGPTSEIDVPWRVLPDIAGKGGYFHDLASHQLDLLDYLLGPVTPAGGVAMNLGGHYACDDTVTAAWRHDTSVAGAGTWCFVAGDGLGAEDIEIVGSDGRIGFTAFSLDLPVRLQRGDHVEEFVLPPPEHVQLPLIQSVVDDLLGRGTCPSTGESAMRTARVMDRILGVA